MAAPIDFYFDFSSPYGYLAAQRIEALAARHGRSVDWHPILLGVIFKETGAAPLTQVPLKGEYSRRDMARRMQAGVCGSPFFVVDGEPFWGLDRFPQLERWLATGGF